MPRTASPRTVTCYHCQRRFDVGGRALTTSCPGCFKRVTVDDIVVKTIESVRKLQTCGRVVVHKTGRVFAQTVEAEEGVQVDGVLEANVVSGGLVRIGPKATWKGDCRAPSLAVELGGKVIGGYFEIRRVELQETSEDVLNG
jgi:cytoskeletal protein CcmA (bactofilin family)